MKIYNVTDPEFKRFGQVLEGYDFAELIDVCKRISPKPQDGFMYEASSDELEALPVAQTIQNRAFGGLPIQIGYCNGTNHTMNCLEYHRSSELNIAIDSVILLLGCQADLDQYRLGTQKVMAFIVPAGVGVELFATTLHYAPCDAEEGGYRVMCVLPRGTNGEKPDGLGDSAEDRLCMGANKWLIAHPEAPEAANGAFVGLSGENIHI